MHERSVGLMAPEGAYAMGLEEGGPVLAPGGEVVEESVESEGFADEERARLFF